MPKLSRALAAAFVTGLAVLAWSWGAVAQTGAGSLDDWNGEYFDQKQGGLFVKVALRGFRASKQTKYLTGNVQITVHNRLKDKRFVISQAAVDMDDDGVPADIWKASSGKYDVVSVVMVDAAGVKRTWRPDDDDEDEEGAKGKKKGGGSKDTNFVVKRQCLSNLGLWTLSPSGKEGLKLVVTKVANSYKESGAKKESSVAAVIDGYTGLIQLKLAGKAAIEGAEDGYGDKKELRATVTFTRQIAMFYKLNLFKHNFRAASIANVLNVYDPNLRRCYTDRLDFNDALRGEVKFTFLLSKEQGTMLKLKHTGGSAGDPKLAECLYYELAHISFPVPETMVGELTYTFDVK